MRLLELQTGRTRVTIAPEAGGRVLQIAVGAGEGWTPLLLEPDDPVSLPDEPLAWGCYPMLPWPGRVAGATFAWGGREYALPQNDGPNSIHGRGVYLPWRVDDAGDASCRLSVELEGWPWAARASHEIAVEDDGVRMLLEVASEGGRFPAGVGWHPWFRRDVVPGAEPSIRLDADEVYETDAGLIPTGRLLPVEGHADLRDGPALGERRLDCCYRRVRGAIGLRWGGWELAMTSTPNVGHAVVYTPARGFCVEPQTCAPDAFNLEARGIAGTGVTVVEPGRPLVAETAWRWRPLPAAS
jgi:aldose 1-epimerase